MSQTPDTTPARPAETGRKAEIIDAATDVFAEKGYDAGSMREIATRVGVSEPALYRHFKGKEALFVAILRTLAGRIRNEIASLVSSVDPEHIRPQMTAILRNRREHVRLYAPVVRMVLPAVARNDAFLAEWREQVVQPIQAALIDKAAEVDAALGVPNGDATRAGRVRALLSLMIGYLASSFVLGDDPDDVVVDAALRVMGWEKR